MRDDAIEVARADDDLAVGRQDCPGVGDTRDLGRVVQSLHAVGVDLGEHPPIALADEHLIASDHRDETLIGDDGAEIADALAREHHVIGLDPSHVGQIAGEREAVDAPQEIAIGDVCPPRRAARPR